MSDWRICVTCGVEYAEPLPMVCPICADERQWVPAEGQRWTTLDGIAAAGQSIRLDELEPGLLGLQTEPKVGIGQVSLVVSTGSGQLLWDPLGYLDPCTVNQIAERGPVLAVASSHPHMFGVQVEWAERFGVPVLVNAADTGWLGRPSPRVRTWSGRYEVADGLTLHQLGGHFPGSAVAHWRDGAEGAGVVLAGDTVMPNPDRRTVSFMRSFPNRLPLSGAVALRLAASLAELAYDRLYGNFGNLILSGAAEVVQRSAERHAAWCRGDFDPLT